MDNLTCVHPECSKAAILVAGIPLCGWHAESLKRELDQPVLAILPPLVMKVRPGTLERFAAQIRFGDDACRFRWAKVGSETGYGRFLLNGRDRGAHVASHLMFIGPIPDGYHVDHVRDRGCTHRSCVWWEHLEAVTPQANVRRGNAGAWQREKTHCKNGHEFTEDNIYWVGIYKDMRACKTCAKEKAAAAYRANPKPRKRGSKPPGVTRGEQQRAKTHCPQGHEYSEDNIYWHEGNRRCKTCTKARGLAQSAARTAARRAARAATEDARTLF